LKLIHYSRIPVVSVNSNSQPTEPDLKPNGLWVSVEGEYDWKWWCDWEDFQPQNLTCPHEVTISRGARILHLNGPEDIDKFTAAYAAPAFLGGRSLHIHWKRVADEYQGIIIAPYVWERRLSIHTFWYYGWDCASGCIWDKAAIKSIVAKWERCGNLLPA
jgi:hypothetical protein